MTISPITTLPSYVKSPKLWKQLKSIFQMWSNTTSHFIKLVLSIYTNKIVMLNNWTAYCSKMYSQCDLKHVYQIPSRSSLLQLMYTITHLLGISNRKHIRRSSWETSSKHYTSLSLAVEHICFFLTKFIPINLCHILNWWYSLGTRTIAINLYTIHKGISFSTLHMLSLTRNSFLNTLTLAQKNVNYIISY